MPMSFFFNKYFYGLDALDLPRAKENVLRAESDTGWDCLYQESRDKFFGECLREEPEAHVGKDSLLLCGTVFSPACRKHCHSPADSPRSPMEPGKPSHLFCGY